MLKREPRTPLQALAAAIQCFDTQETFGAAIGKSQGYVSMLLYRMKNKDMKVPLGICPSIEAATGGAVSRKELRPDFPWEVPASATASDQAAA